MTAQTYMDGILSRLRVGKVIEKLKEQNSRIKPATKTVNKADLVNKLRVIADEVAKELKDLKTHKDLKGEYEGAYVSRREANRIMEHITYEASRRY